MFAFSSSFRSVDGKFLKTLPAQWLVSTSPLDVWLIVEYVAVGDCGEMGGLFIGGGHRTDSQLILDSVGDMVRISGGRTLSCDRGCRMASRRSVEPTKKTILLTSAA